MVLIADSGSTKTTWALIDKGELKTTIQTPGLNPYFHTSETIEATLRADLAPNLSCDFIKEIHFYGAGCSTENNNNMLKESMRVFFRKADIFIYHDILGAARALFGKKTGVACILGTGCNSCYYDGNEVESKVSSLGYLFGDEGAGSNLGKTFMEKYLKNKLPEDIRKEFDAVYKFTLEDILNSIYNRPFPNRWLASFSEFIAPRQDHPFIYQLVKRSFNSFIEEQISHYDNHRDVPVSFVGSIAFFYKDILLEVAKEKGISVETIMRSPLEGLIAYHTTGHFTG
jgi:N-acetylglucosamine kinase-like BadF-type ATPase